MGKNFWMVVETPENFEVTKRHGFTLYGVSAKYRRRAQRMQPEDHIVFYVTRLRKWAATATIKSSFFEDHTPVWNTTEGGEDYPFRVKLAPNVVLEEPDYIDALILAPRLDYVKRWAPEDWPLAFFDSLHLLPQRDFRLIEGEMKRILSRHHSAAHTNHAAGSNTEEIPDEPGDEAFEEPDDSPDQRATEEASSAGSI